MSRSSCALSLVLCVVVIATHAARFLAIPCGRFSNFTGSSFTPGTFFFALGDLDGDSDLDLVAVGGVHTFNYLGLATPFARKCGREASFAESFRNDGTGRFSRMQPIGSFLFAPSEVCCCESSSSLTLHSPCIRLVCARFKCSGTHRACYSNGRSSLRLHPASLA